VLVVKKPAEERTISGQQVKQEFICMSVFIFRRRIGVLLKVRG
jgi:hypothetical protein